jgi:copper chaperone
MKAKQISNETILDVAGMSCPSCVRHINDALGELAGVSGVDVRLDDGTVRVRHDPAAAPVDSLIGALTEAGYDASVAA